MVVPIFFRNEFAGSVGACGLLTENDAIDAFLINKITEIDEAEVERLSKDIDSKSMEQLKSIAGFIKEEIRRIIEERRA